MTPYTHVITAVLITLGSSLLAALGLDHTQLTFRHGGRDQRLTDVHGHVIRQILA